MPFLSQADGAEPTGSILAFDLALIFRIGIQWINIGILAFILVKLLYNPVKNMLADRAERIKSDIESARKNNEESQELKASYKKLIDNIEKERDEILAEARRVAIREHDRMIFEAQEETNSLRKKAADEIEVERKNAADDIKRQIIEISTVMAARFVAVSIDKDTQDKYIAEALADWSERTWQA